MTTIDETRIAIANSGLRPTHKVTLWFLLANCEEGDASPITIAPMSMDDMARMTGWTFGTISQYLRALELVGWITRERWDTYFDRVYYAITPPAAALAGVVRYIRTEPSKRRKERVKKRDGYRCVRCGATEDLTVDHIQPLRFGGTNDEDNLQTLCRPCNSGKGLRV